MFSLNSAKSWDITPRFLLSLVIKSIRFHKKSYTTYPQSSRPGNKFVAFDIVAPGEIYSACDANAGGFNYLEGGQLKISRSFSEIKARAHQRLSVKSAGNTHCLAEFAWT